MSSRNRNLSTQHTQQSNEFEPIETRNASFKSHVNIGRDANPSDRLEFNRYRTFPSERNQNSIAPFECGCSHACDFCEQNRYLSMGRDYHEKYTTIGRQSNLCRLCYYQSICADCQKDICARCNRNVKYQPLRTHHLKQLSSETTNLAMSEQNYDERFSTQMTTTSEFSKPYSFNIDKASLFYPSDANADINTDVISSGELNRMKHITEEKLRKYAKNYGDMHERNAMCLKMNEIYQPKAKKLNEVSTSTNINTDAFAKLESRWQVI